MCYIVAHLIYQVVEGAQGHRNAMAFFIFQNMTIDAHRAPYQTLAFGLNRRLETQKLFDRSVFRQKK